MAAVQISNPWKASLRGLSGVLFALGLAETIASILVINTSGGTYAGGIYAGILCMITGIRGCFMGEGFRLLVLIIFSVLSSIISIVAASLQATNYNLLASLYACVSSSGTCSYLSNYYSYCTAASYCEFVTTTGYDCSCVGSSSGTCYAFNHISCSNILTSLPAQIHSSYIICIICIVASSLLVITTSLAHFRATDGNQAINAPLFANSSNPPVMTTATVLGTSTQTSNHSHPSSIPVMTTATVVSNPVVVSKENDHERSREPITV